MRRALLILALLLGFPGAAAAKAPEASRGISLQGTISERGVVSARAVGSHLYVSSMGGVTIYDISAPRTPVQVGRLDLPNAQNEDVDVGNGILLVSDDPVGGRGVLNIVDVSNPAAPRLLSTYSTWRRRWGGIGHTASCIDDCRYAWLAGSADGIEIVDLRDPAHPRLARRFAARPAAGRLGTHDVQVDPRGLAWVAGARGTAAYDVSDPARPKLVMRTNKRGSRGPYNNFIHHNSLRLGRRTVAITEEDFGNQCRGEGTLQTWRIGRGGKRLRPLDSIGVERDSASQVMCSAHYFDEDRGLIAQGFYEQGVRLFDARRAGRLRQVGYYISRPGLVWGAIFAPTDPSGSTIYSVDHSRGIDVLTVDRAALRPVKRRGARRRVPVPPQGGVGLLVDDGYDVLEAGQRLRIAVVPYGHGGPAQVEVTVPPEIVDVRPPGGMTFDPLARKLRFSVARVRDFEDRYVRARVAEGVARGTPIELIGYVTAPDDPLALDDRGVDRGVVGADSRVGPFAAAASGARRGFCALP